MSRDHGLRLRHQLADLRKLGKHDPEGQWRSPPLPEVVIRRHVLARRVCAVLHSREPQRLDHPEDRLDRDLFGKRDAPVQGIHPRDPAVRRRHRVVPVRVGQDCGTGVELGANHQGPVREPSCDQFGKLPRIGRTSRPGVGNGQVPEEVPPLEPVGGRCQLAHLGRSPLQVRAKIPHRRAIVLSEKELVPQQVVGPGRVTHLWPTPAHRDHSPPPITVVERPPRSLSGSVMLNQKRPRPAQIPSFGGSADGHKVPSLGIQCTQEVGIAHGPFIPCSQIHRPSPSRRPCNGFDHICVSHQLAYISESSWRSALQPG